LAALNEATTSAIRLGRIGACAGGVLGVVLGLVIAGIGAAVRTPMPHAAVLNLFGFVLLSMAGLIIGVILGGLVGGSIGAVLGFVRGWRSRAD